MAVINTAKQLVGKIDRMILRLMGERKDFQRKLIIPKHATAAELKRSLIKDYVKVQPSFLQVVLLALYVNLRHIIGVIIRQAFRKLKGISQ